MITFLSKRPWLLIVLAFALLIGGWVFLLKLAAENRPQSVPIESVESHDSH